MPSLVLAPTPLAATRAARRLCDAQGGLLFGPQVATLDRLAPALLAAAGDRRAILGPLAERLVAADAGRDAGGAFAALHASDGLAASLAATLGELREAEVSPAEARAAAEELPGAAGARLGALAAALEAYEARLARLGVLDRAGALRAAAEALRRGARTAETEELELLAVLGLVSAGASEWDLLAALVARARRARFHLPFFPDRPALSAPAEPLLRRLEALHDLQARREVEVVLPRLEGDGRSARAAALLAAFAGGPLRSPAGDGLVLAMPGDGEEGEPEAAAAAVARMLEAGLAPEEVALIAPAPRRSAPGLARALGALGIPFAAGRGLPLASVPAARAVLDLLEAAGGERRRAVERVAASSYLAPGPEAPLGPLLDRAGALEGRLAPAAALRRRAGALTAPGGARERSALDGRAGALERLLSTLAPLAAPGTAREQAARLAAFVEAGGIRRRAARAPRAIAARDLAALAGLDDAAEGLVRALALAGRGAERLSAGSFRALLDLAVEAAALPPAGEPAAGAVELSGLEEAPGLSARGAVLLGCARGAWPPAAAPEPLLRDAERVALARAARRAILPTGAARRARSLHLAFAAAAAGREALAFVWGAPGASGRGAPLAPLVADALAAVGVAVPAAPGGDPPLALARTPRAALRAAARLGDAGVAALAATPLADRAGSALARGAAARARRDARPGAPSPHAGALDGPALAVLRAALPEAWAPTALETFAACPFRLFVQLALRVPDRAAAELDPDARDEGSLLHAVLERFVAGRMARRAWPLRGDEADLAEASEVAGEVFARFEAEGRTGDPAVWVARREAVLGRIARFVRAEAEVGDGLVPARVEHAFGVPGAAPALELEADGEVVRLRGRIDRVDAGPDRLLVIDYKSGKDGKVHAGKLAPEAFGTESFQVPAYLLVAARDLPGRSRLSATYAMLGAGTRVSPVELEAGDPVLVARVAGATSTPSPTSTSPPTPQPFAAAVVETVRRIRAGQFPVRPGGCEHCPHRAICRLDALAADEEGP